MIHRATVAALAALCCACAIPPARPAPASGPELRVMTFNIRAGTDLEGRPNLDRVAALVDSLGADIVLLQEVDRGTARSGRADQVAVLESGTGMRGVFGRAMDFDGGQYGNAALSRLPVLRARVIPLDVTVPDELGGRYYEPRSLMHLVVATASGPVHVLNTHLDHQRDHVFRHPQLMAAMAYIAGAVPADAAVILAGDLNARPGTHEVRALGLRFDDAWVRCGTGPGYTFRSDRPDRRIDYVLLAGARCRSAAVHPTTISDHRPVVVDVILAAPPAGPQD